ncbi:DUF2793 domain-containing protein [Consotaella aegiceratis]|uniref:DUF2793 domain-containing protein n=1 Tax=Consotaella aegiceratis TaxID=3097961 RepID=UPI002F3FB20E
MDTTEILSLPLIMPSQAQKHVTHNEALAMLDVLVQTSVAGLVPSPPDVPLPGDRWIVAEDAGGAFAGREGSLAVFQGGAWSFLPPQAGWLAYDRGAGRLLACDGALWAPLPLPSEMNGIESLGVNAAADAENRLVVAAPNSLFTHEGAGHRLKVNKADEAETASLLFQSGWSGRAEIGLAGSDDLALKVSADGATWREALRVERASGRVRFPSGGAREQLAEARTYYVDPAGSDANTGLSAGDAFATVQKAVNAALALDAAGYPVTIQLADGVYGAGAAMSRPMFDGGTLLLRGNATSPENVLIDAGSAGNALLFNAAGASARIEGIKVAGQVGIWARFGVVVMLRGRIAYGVCTARHIGADNGAYIEVIATIDIQGGAQQHFFAGQNGHILMTNSTVNLIGTPAFTNAFAVAQTTGIVSAYANAYAGSATGMRYRTLLNGVVFVNGAGEASLPGDAVGLVSSGGQYG